MGNKFYISAVPAIYNDKCFREVINTFPEGVPECIKQMVFDTDEDAPEQEEVLCYIDGQSISGVKISTLKDGDTSVFLGWNASGMDVHMCFEYLRAVQKLHPEAVVTCSDADGNKTSNVADLSEDAINDEWGKRIEIMASLLDLDEEVVKIPAIRYTYNLQPKKFAEETEGMSLGDKIMKLYGDIIDMQWYDAPEPKAYMLRWNTAISNFKIKDFEDCMKQFRDPAFCLSWSIWDWQDARIGDKVYMLRVGEGTTGIVMAGEIISEPYVDEDWSGKGRVTHYVDIRLDQLIHPEKATILDTEDLSESFDGIEWTGGHSGTLLSAKDAYHLEKLFDKYLVDNRKQFEDSDKAVTLDEIPEEYKDYFDPHQGHGGHWGTIVNTDKVDLIDFLQSHLEGSKEVATVNTTMNDEDGFAMPVTVMGLTTGDEEVAMTSLIIEGEERNEFIAAFPALKDTGTEVTMKLVKVNEYANGLEGVLTCETEFGANLCFFDTDYYLHKDEYKIRESYTFKLGALASEAEVLPEEDRVMKFSVEQTINMANAEGSEIEYDEDGNVVPREWIMDQLVYCMNTVDEVPDEYGFQSPVTNSKALKIWGTPMYRMNVTVVRTEDEPDAVVIPMYAKKAFFDKKPKKNEAVRGMLWMLGSMVK